MTFPRLRFICKNQKGFTLLEILVAVALVGIITAGITAAINQLLTINTRASNHMVAVRQVQQAGKEVSKDTLQAQIVELAEPAESPPGTNFPLTLTWMEWATNYTHEVIYTLEDSELWRSESINGGNVTLTRVAQYIDPAPDQTSCDWDGGVLTFTVTATVGGQSETRVYEIEPRPD